MYNLVTDKCEHGTDWLYCETCKVDELAYAEALEELVNGLIQDRNDFFGGKL